MANNHFKLIIMLLCGFLLLCGTTFADMITFDDASLYSAADGASSYNLTDNNVNMTFKPLVSGKLYWKEFDGNGYQDGFGIQDSDSYEQDEVEGSEVLQISFLESLHVNDFFLTDFFYEDTSNSSGAYHWYEEIGYYSLDGTNWMQFAQTDHSVLPSNYPDSNAQTNGLYTLGINSDVSSIYFTAPGLRYANDNNGKPLPGVEGHEFSVIGFDYTPVPEPSTYLLVGLSMILFASLNRKKFFKK